MSAFEVIAHLLGLLGYRPSFFLFFFGTNNILIFFLKKKTSFTKM
jgi:hypothetical protein